jgi:hypothetical protein
MTTGRAKRRKRKVKGNMDIFMTIKLIIAERGG